MTPAADSAAGRIGLDAFGLPPLRDDAWHAARARVIGGSEIAALFGVQPDYALSHYALWHVKAGRIEPPEVSGARPAWGLRLERTIAEAAAEQEGWTVEPRGHVAHPRGIGLGCTLDYIITAGEPGRDTIGVLELKNADWLQHRRAWTDGEPPLHILLQLQTQLACTGATWGAIACLVGGNDLRIYRYEARPKLIADIERRTIAFWQSIADNKPPPVDGSDSAAAALRALYPVMTDEEADLSADNELPDLCARLTHATAARSKAEKEEAALKAGIFAKIGAHKRASTEGFRIKVAVTPENPGVTITPAMVGQVINKRKESRRLTVVEVT